MSQPTPFTPHFVYASLPYGRVHVVITTSHATVTTWRDLRTVCGKAVTHMYLRLAQPVPHSEVCRQCLHKLGAR